MRREALINTLTQGWGKEHESGVWVAEGEFGQMLPWTSKVAPEDEAGGVGGEGREGGGELGEGLAGGSGVDFVLDDDVGSEALAVLRGEPLGEGGGEACVEGAEGGGFELEGDSTAKGAEADYGDGKRGDVGCGDELSGDEWEFSRGKMMEECDVGGDEVAFRREVALAEDFKVLLGVWFECECEDEGLAGHRVTLAVNKDGDVSPVH